MPRTLDRHRLVALLGGVMLVASACSSESAPPTAPPTSLAGPVSSSTSSTTTTIPAATPNGPAIAREGDRTETVRALQFLINCDGYGQLTVDGAFGPATLSAIQDVQAAFGKEVTGAPDDETFALLSRECADDRRVTIDEADAGEQIVVGNAAPGDPEMFFIRGDAGMRMSVVLDTEAGDALVSVRSAGGAAIGTNGVGAWSAEIPETGDFVVEVSAESAVTFAATVALVTFDQPDVTAAGAGKVVVDGLDSSVASTCLDTGGEFSYIAETALGQLVITTGRVGRFGLDHGGVGAPVEFLFGDGSPGYYGFGMDLDVEVSDRVVGTGTVFQRGAGHADEPLGLAFDFGRAVTPCDGTSGTSVVLGANGLGIVDFGADPEEALDVVRQALIGASPEVDSGWVAIDNLSNSFGVCRSGTTEVRSVDFDNLTMYFTNSGTSFAPEGTRHLAAFVAQSGVFPFRTAQGVGPGDTIAAVLAAHPDSVAAPGLTGGVDVYITSPPGSDRWLRATASGTTSTTDTSATITSIAGGRFCDQ